eukprot:SAG31_NODE_1231_length_9212_cov_2.857566_6_plen_141_part_00
MAGQIMCSHTLKQVWSDFQWIFICPVSQLIVSVESLFCLLPVDCFEWAVSRPAEHAPGTVGRYRNCDPLTLGFLVRMAAEAAGEDYLSYPQKTLFDQIGIRKQVCQHLFCNSGVPTLSANGWNYLGYSRCWRQISGATSY